MDFKSNRVTLFREQYEAISKLPVNIQGKVYKAVIDYNFTGITPKLSGAAQLAFDLIKAGIDVSLSKQRAGQAGGKQNGSRSEAERKQEQSKYEAEDKQTPSNEEAEAKQIVSKTEANCKQNGSRSEAERKQEQSKYEAEDKQTPSNEEAEAKQIVSKTEANCKQNGSSEEKRSIEKISIEREEKYREEITGSKKVSKKEKENASARGQSYEELMDDLEVSDIVRPMLWEFIKHCQANGRKLINSKLRSIILSLDETYPQSERMKVFSLKKAIDGGYFDVKENKQRGGI